MLKQEYFATCLGKLISMFFLCKVLHFIHRET